MRAEPNKASPHCNNCLFMEVIMTNSSSCKELSSTRADKRPFYFYLCLRYVFWKDCSVFFSTEHGCAVWCCIPTPLSYFPVTAAGKQHLFQSRSLACTFTAAAGWYGPLFSEESGKITTKGLLIPGQDNTFYYTLDIPLQVAVTASVKQGWEGLQGEGFSKQLCQIRQLEWTCLGEQLDSKRLKGSLLPVHCCET